MREQNRRLENQGVCPNYLSTYTLIIFLSMRDFQLFNKQKKLFPEGLEWF